jgi:mannose-6-phosphate isomerase-like protein (cupin superfamily)
MHFNSIRKAAINRRGGQTSYLLLGKGQSGSERLAITWVDCRVGSEQPVHRHPDAEQVYFIIAGRGTMVVGNDERTVEGRTLVFIPPDTVRRLWRHSPSSSGSLDGCWATTFAIGSRALCGATQT